MFGRIPLEETNSIVDQIEDRKLIDEDSKSAVKMIGDLVEQLQDAKDKIEQASEILKNVARTVRREKGFDPGYNMSGNMEAYVIAYLTDGHDSMVDKIEEYMNELKDMADPDETGEE